MEPLTDVPNLPHFRDNKPRTRRMSGDFTYNGGLYFFEQAPRQQTLLDLHHKAASTSLQIHRKEEPSGQSALLGSSTGMGMAGYVTNSGLVLRFESYFKESVDESPLENHRVRKCRILVYLEDSSMEIDEYRQQNSGMLQGILVKRHHIPYPEGKSGHYTVDDITVGGTIDVYGRRFHVIDADRATRLFLRDRLGRVEAPAIPLPTDRYTVERKEFMSRQTGCDRTVRHGIGKDPNLDNALTRLVRTSTITREQNEVMVFAEALLGNTVDNSKRAGFIKYDRNVLRFQAVWDDRRSLYGDIQRFELHYFLEDDTIEIRSLHGPNSGRDPVPIMVKRGKIPKSFSGGDASEVYHWKDFGIGVELNVYERPLVLVDADVHTRQFYASSGVRLGNPILPDPTPEPDPDPLILPPPVNSFIGSVDDDELASRSTSLVPSPPRKIRGEDVMFRYTAELVSDILEDKGREFIITYYKADRTVMVREPPRKNSGIIGGNFLSRMKVRDVSGNVITEGCFYVGAEVTIHGHLFRVTGADDKTLRLMEERSADAFTFSDPVRAAEVISGWMGRRIGDLRTLLRERDTESTGETLRATLRHALESFGVEFSPTTPEQVLITVMRAVGGDASSAPYENIVDRLEEPGGFQHGL